MSANVLVLDDDVASRQSLVRSLQASDFATIAPPGPFLNLQALRDFAHSEGATHVVSDHRLTERRFCSFLGASAASALNMMKIAPILVTAYAKQDMDIDIRPHLAYIPKVIQRIGATLGPAELREALEAAGEEVRMGNIPRHRKNYRSVIDVEELVQNSQNGPMELRLRIRQWRKEETVGFPASALAADIQSALTPGMLLIAQVNIEATTSDELFLKDFEMPPTEDNEF